MHRIAIVIIIFILAVSASAQDKDQALSQEIEQLKVDNEELQKHIVKLINQVYDLKGQRDAPAAARIKELEQVIRQLKTEKSGLWDEVRKLKEAERLAPSIASLSSTPERFHLKSDKKGKLYGPFECANGAAIAIGRATFTIQKKQPSPLEKQIAGMVIPEVDFRMADIRDVFDYLANATGEIGGRGKRVNFVFRPAKEPKHVTLAMKSATVLEVLNEVVQQASLKCMFSRNTVTIYSPQNQ